MADGVRGEVLQLAENVTAVPFGVGNQTGQDLLPLPFKGILSSYVASPGCFFSFLLSVLGMEAGCGAGNAPLDGNVSCCTMFN
jgi:hypothetical protein